MKKLKAFRIDEDLVNRLEDQAKHGYESQTDIIENALRKYFTKRPVSKLVE